MIAGTYLPLRSAAGHQRGAVQSGALDAVTQTTYWCVIFFFASAGASAAYLTVSEIFPVEVRAKAIAVFFAIAQSFGAFGPWLYGKLIGNGRTTPSSSGLLLGAAVTIIGAVVEDVPRRRRRAEVSRRPGSASRRQRRPGTFASVTGAPRPPAAQVIPTVPGPPWPRSSRRHSGGGSSATGR